MVTPKAPRPKGNPFFGATLYTHLYWCNKTVSVENRPPPTPFKGGGDEAPRHAYITANPYTYGKIKEFRDILKENPTKAEELLWQYLRTKKQAIK